MVGEGVQYRLKLEGYKATITQLERKISELYASNLHAMQRAVELVRASAENNIRYGRPEWPDFKYKEGIGAVAGLEGLYKTGELARSMRGTVISPSRDEITGVVYTDVDYAAYHELGTHGCSMRRGGPAAMPGGHVGGAIPARPFLLPAFTDNQDNIVKIFQEEARRAIT